MKKDLSNKPDIERASLRMESIWMDAENRIIHDIVRRIKTYGKITSTADYQINRLIEMGKSREEVEKIIKEAMNLSWPEMFKLYDDISEWEYVRNKDIYEQVNREFIPPEDNEWLKQSSEAVKTQTMDELKNISQSYGFAVNINGKTVFTPFAEYYQKYVDSAIMDIITGGFDYNTVLRRVVSQMTNSGLRIVDYASGWSNRAPVAVRRAFMTGVGQITGNIVDRQAEELGVDHFEVDWHAGARPEHRAWQGKVYTKRELVTVCGLGTGPGLKGWNCYHDYYLFWPGISERMYTDEFLREQNAKEAVKKQWKDKELDTYEQTQQMRKMETSMRSQRSKIAALKVGDYDQDQLTLEKAKYQAQLYEYTVFCNKMGMKQQRERIYMDGLGRLAPQSIKQANKVLEKKRVDDIIKSELREIGIKGKINIKPEKIDLSMVSFDDQHINKQRKHNVSIDEAKTFIENASFSETVWNGRFERYYSSNGVAYVNKNNLQIRTAFKGDEIKGVTQKAIEVMKKHGR